MAKRERLSIPGVIVGDISAAWSACPAGSARLVPGWSKKSQSIDGRSGSSQATRAPCLLPAIAIRVATKAPGSRRWAPPRNWLEPSGPVTKLEGDSALHVPDPLPRMRSPARKPARPIAARVFGLVPDWKLSASRAVPQLLDAPGGQRVSEIVRFPLAACSVALRRLVSGAASLAAGRASISSETSSRIEVGRFTGLPPVSPRTGHYARTRAGNFRPRGGDGRHAPTSARHPATAPDPGGARGTGAARRVRDRRIRGRQARGGRLRRTRR